MYERRQVERVSVNGVVAASVKSTVPARVIEISTSGVRVEIPTALRPSVNCRFALEVESGEVFEIRVRVRRCRIRQLGTAETRRTEVSFIAGLEFEAMDWRTRRKLERLLAGLDTRPATARLLN